MPDYSNNDIEHIEERVDVLEQRMTKVETTLGDFRNECSRGFADLKEYFRSCMDERKQWSIWLRNSFSNIGKWLAKWGAIVLLAAIGCNQVINIYKAFH